MAHDDFLKEFNEHFDAGRDPAPEDVERRQSRELHEKQVRVVGVFEHPKGAFVLLRDSRGRAVPIFIGPAEATSISLIIEGVTPQRPLTHDLMKLVMDRFNVEVESILIDDLYNAIYYAKMIVRQGGKPVEIDCRPSDAVAMALRYRAPIYVADAVLEEAKLEWQDD